jgi:alpha-tubulin suppressor-like RCC1 family protein
MRMRAADGHVQARHVHRAAAVALGAAVLLAGATSQATLAAFVDSGGVALAPATAATVDIAFADGGAHHELTLEGGPLAPGETVTGTVGVFNSGSADSDLSMTAPTTTIAGSDPDPTGLSSALRLVVATGDTVLYEGSLLDAAFDGGGLTLPAGGSPQQANPLTISLRLDDDAPVTAAGHAVDVVLNFASSRSTFSVGGHVKVAAETVAPVTFPIRDVSVGAQHTLVLDEQGGLWAWGSNARGQLGDGTHENRFSPVRTAVSEPVAKVSAGIDTSIALTESGRVLTWGNGDVTGVFSGTDTNVPAEVTGGWSRPVAVATGGYFFLVLDEEGALWSWGNNGDGRLGRYGSGDIPTPGRVTAQSLNTQRVSGIHASRYAGIVYTDDGSVVAWGTQHGSTGGRTVAGLPSARVAGVTVSYSSRLALLEDGRVYQSTGASDFEATGLTGIRRISSSAAEHVSEQAFLATDGAGLWGWGSNAYGQLGLGESTPTVAEPTAISLDHVGSGSIQSAGLGRRHALIVMTDGSISSAGTGSNGELGAGTVLFAPEFLPESAVSAWPGEVDAPIAEAVSPPGAAVPEDIPDEVPADDGIHVEDSREPDAVPSAPGEREDEQEEEHGEEHARPEPGTGEGDGGSDEEQGAGDGAVPGLPETTQPGDASEPDTSEPDALEPDALEPDTLALGTLEPDLAEDPDAR